MHRHHHFSLTALAAAAGLYGIVLTDTAHALRPFLPPGGDCRAMVAVNGGKGIWYGQFSGRYEDTFRDGFYYPVAARGCFTSEYKCRRWLNELLSIASGSSALMSCRPYNQKRRRRY